MTELQVFNNSDFGEVRVVDVNGEPYMVGNDVAKILGYKKPRNAISRHIDVEDKTTALIWGAPGIEQDAARILDAQYSISS